MRSFTRIVGILVGCAHLVVVGAHAGAWPQLGSLTDITYSGGKFVAVGTAGNLVWSTDGVAWTKGAGGGTHNFVGVAHTGSQFVAVDEDGVLLKSTDAATWSALGTVSAEGFATDIAYGAGTYVVVDNYGYIYASSNGSNWTVEFEPAATADEELYGVTYANGKFVAVGIRYNDNGDSYGLIRASSTGLSWTRERQTLNEEFYGVAFVNGEFLAVGMRYDNDFNTFSHLVASTTGTTWTARTLPGEDALFCAAYGDGVAAIGGDYGGLLVNAGTGWSQRWDGNATDAIVGIAYGAGRFVAIDASGIAAGSTDGKAWAGDFATPPENLATMCAGSALVTGGDLNGTLWTSSGDGVWANTYYSPYVEIKETIHSGGVYVAVGIAYDLDFNTYSAILRSTDALSWEVVRSVAGEELYGIGFGDGQFVAVGYLDSAASSFDQVLTSSDGKTWTSRSAGTGSSGLGLNAVCYGTNRWVALGVGGTVVTSTTGTAWTESASGTSEDLTDVVFGNGEFVAVGSKGTVLVSPNGQTWDKRSVGADRQLESVVFTGKDYYTVGATGFVARATSPSAWTPVASGVTVQLRDAVALPDKVMVVGDNGTVLSFALAAAEPAQLVVARTDDPALPIQITIQGRPNSTHQLEKSDVIAPEAATNWSLQQAVTLGADGKASVSLPRSGAQRFFRCIAR